MIPPRMYPVIADCVSYGFALMVIVGVTASNMLVSPPYAVVIVAIYASLRMLARSIRRSVRMQQRAASSA